MQILTNSKQNIFILFQGYGENAYIVYNNFWGVIATADISKEYIGNTENGVEINLYLDYNQGSYFINDIKRLINKAENQYINKKLKYNISYKENLKNCYLKASIENY